MDKLFEIMLVSLLCGVTFIFILSATDLEWIPVEAKSTTSSSVYYRPGFLWIKSGKPRTLLLKVIYNKESLDRMFDNNKDYFGVYSHTLLKAHIDCVNSKYLTVEESSYSIDGNYLGGFTLLDPASGRLSAPLHEINIKEKRDLTGSLPKEEPRQYTDILPGTAEDEWRHFACESKTLDRIAITLKALTF